MNTTAVKNPKLKLSVEKVNREQLWWPNTSGAANATTPRWRGDPLWRMAQRVPLTKGWSRPPSLEVKKFPNIKFHKCPHDDTINKQWQFVFFGSTALNTKLNQQHWSDMLNLRTAYRFQDKNRSGSKRPNKPTYSWQTDKGSSEALLPKNQHTVGMKGSQEVKLPQTNIQLVKRFANLFKEQIPALLKIRRSSFVKEALLIFNRQTANHKRSWRKFHMTYM